jgi:hypothetical protein
VRCSSPEPEKSTKEACDQTRHLSSVRITRQRLFRIACGRLVGLTDRPGAFDDLRSGAPHANRADVLLAEGGRPINARL